MQLMTLRKLKYKQLNNMYTNASAHNTCGFIQWHIPIIDNTHVFIDL